MDMTPYVRQLLKGEAFWRSGRLLRDAPLFSTDPRVSARKKQTRRFQSTWQRRAMISTPADVVPRGGAEPLEGGLTLDPNGAS